ncbi:hypothetical protein Leryth_026345 [Lithospermum erythrorhizon]|nr:hypothetical protein Leryth_026345 [Lithospermum erythrorhizon]
MEPNVPEALKAKAYAEKHFAEGDFTGARKYALKAQMICPQLEGISQMVATFGVYTASEVRINGEIDLYGILGLEPSADKSRVKKQYKKMAVLLHPDKNKSVGADGAFKYVSDAWTVLSDHVKRSMYDQRRNISALHAPGNGSYINYSKPPVSSHHRLDTFWTVCSSCHVQYEYLRKYINKRLSCKNCRGVFIAVETGAAPGSGSYQYTPWSYVQEKGYGGHGCGVTYMPNNTSVYCATNDVSGYHPGSEYPSNVTIQFNSFPGTPADGMDLNGFSTSTYVNHQLNGKANRAKSNAKDSMKRAAVNVVSNGHDGCRENPVSKPGWSAKKRKIDAGSGSEEIPSRNSTETRAAYSNGNLKPNSKLHSSTETSLRRHSTAPAFDVRQLLIDKARSDISKKVEEMRLASEAEKKSKALAEAVIMSAEALKTSESNSTIHQSELKRTTSMSITVPDSDFHDFDKDRSEECFKPKQIWALYDEDGMPRLYCLIRQVISVKPFKIFISYLSSKTDSEFGSVNWLGSGFTKSCGSFRVFHSETVEQVNIFSHLLSKEKAGRGGCVRIYPRSGDIWAVYRNWSPDWNRQTPDDVRHQYEMVEVLGNYSEDNGVCVTPLVKVDGYKTVYQRNNSDSLRWIPKREMLRFSHQVPACLLKGEAFNLPDDCFDLDPAATPDQLLQRANELLNDSIPSKAEDNDEISSVQYLSVSNTPGDARANISVTAPDDEIHAQATTQVQVLDCCQEENLSIRHAELPLTGANVTA